MRNVQRTLAFVAPLLSAAVLAAPAAARPFAPTVVSPTQELAALGATHEAFAAPSLSSTPLVVLLQRRPLTGERTVLPVLGSATGAAGAPWLHVRLPGRPNGRTGWILGRATTISSTGWHLVVDLSRRSVTVYLDGEAVRTLSAVVGKPSTPTPTGQFFVEEAIKLGAGDVGAPYALALSARSNTLQEFDGGPGQIALHGLMNVGGIPGTARSHGCIRVTDVDITWLAARVGPGTPVTISQ